jgi:modulator of FtsH protease HflC
MSKKLLFSLIVLAGLIICAVDSFFIINQAQQALVLQFGEYKTIHTTPGIKFKIPFIQDVSYLEKRVIDVAPPIPQVLLSDQKRIDIDAYARYKIIDPLKFYRAVRSEARAQERLSGMLDTNLRKVLGSVTLTALLSAERKNIMTKIRTELQLNSTELGIDIIDVRIVRADLPQQTSEAIYRSMRSEREREASEFRAQGAELAQKIRSSAERERTVIITEAQKESEILRGQGDAQAIQVYADAYQIDPQFYDFYRSLEAYKTSLSKGDTTLLLSPNSEFMKFFGKKIARQ